MSGDDFYAVSASRADTALKGYFIAAAGLNLAALACPPLAALPVVTDALGAAWNLWDAGGGIFIGNNDYHKAEKSKGHRKTEKKTIAGVNLFWSTVGMPGLTVLGLVVGTAAALSASSFSFAGAMFICCVQSERNYRQAKYKSNEINLFYDRYVKYIKRREKASGESGYSSSQAAELTRLKIQACAIYRVKLIGNNKNLFPHYQSSTAPAKEIKKDLDLVRNTTATLSDQVICDFLIKKQKQKATKHLVDTCAWFLAGAGASCLGVSLIAPVAAPFLGVAAAALYLMAAGIKSWQLIQQWQQCPVSQEIKNHVIRSYIQDKAGGKTGGVDQKSEAAGVANEEREVNDMEDNLIAGYLIENFNGNGIESLPTQNDKQTILESLSPKDRERVLNQAYRKQYASLNRRNCLPSRSSGIFSSQRANPQGGISLGVDDEIGVRASLLSSVGA